MARREVVAVTCGAAAGTSGGRARTSGRVTGRAESDAAVAGERGLGGGRRAGVSMYRAEIGRKSNYGDEPITRRRPCPSINGRGRDWFQKIL